jgi:predicted enzyme related to lactoylglutathione lyase
MGSRRGPGTAASRAHPRGGLSESNVLQSERESTDAGREAASLTWPSGHDCQTQDLDAAASFWSAALGRNTKSPENPESGNYRELQGPPREVTVLVQAVQHPSRVHVDIETDDINAEVLRLEALGAKRVAQVKSWWVMEAPTGQRFCVVRPQRPDFEEHANAWPPPSGV